MLSRTTSRKIADLERAGVLEVNDGYRAKNVELGNVGLPFARVPNVSDGFSFEGADLLLPASVQRAGSKISRPEDCVLTTKGSVGRFAFVREDTPRFVYSPQICYWRVLDRTVIEPRWLHYWMQSREFGDQADAVKGSTDMADYVSLTNQRRMLVTLPAIEDQRRVAAILGAIDDLMEISRRRIALHDEVLRMVYREWFVERRFPGHEAIENADAAGAPLPAGWRVAELGTLADLNAQKVRAADAPPSIDYVDISSVSPGEVKRTDRVRFEDAPGRARRRVAHGDTIWSSVRPNRRSFAVVLNPSDDLIVSTGFTVITPRDLPWTYEYFAVTSDPFVDFLVGHATGAAYPAVTATDFALAPVVVPKADLLERFHRFAEPAMLLVDGLRRANATLRSTRDLLLPRLVGGPVDTARVSGPTQHPAT